MSTDSSLSSKEKNTLALQAFLKDESASILELDVQNSACLCDALVPRRLADLWMYIRCTIMMFANCIPVSPLRIFLYRLMGMRVGRGVYISPQVVLDPLYPHLITLEDDALLGMGCKFLAHEYTTTHFRLGRIRVGRGSVIGAYAVVRSGVSIGERAMVGMQSFVNRNVPDHVMVGGVPARELSKQETTG